MTKGMTQMRNNVYLYHRNVNEFTKEVKKLKEIGEKHGFNIVNQPEDANIIAAVGGDGAFLQAVRYTGFRQDAIYVGFGRGLNEFYCDFDIHKLDEIDRLFSDNSMRIEEGLEVRKYPLLSASINESTPLLCLNEASIKSSIIKSLAIEVYIDDLHFETFRGDGMVVSTPTGSTAYNKSLSGAVVDPLIPCMQVSEIASVNNNRYRTLGSSFIVHDSRKLSLRIVEDGNDYPIIGMDNEALSLKYTDRIDIELSDKVIKTVKLRNNSFWHKVQRSFF